MRQNQRRAKPAARSARRAGCDLCAGRRNIKENDVISDTCKQMAELDTVSLAPYVARARRGDLTFFPMIAVRRQLNRLSGLLFGVLGNRQSAMRQARRARGSP